MCTASAVYCVHHVFLHQIQQPFIARKKYKGITIYIWPGVQYSTPVHYKICYITWGKKFYPGKKIYPGPKKIGLRKMALDILGFLGPTWFLIFIDIYAIIYHFIKKIGLRNVEELSHFLFTKIGLPYCSITNYSVPFKLKI